MYNIINCNVTDLAGNSLCGTNGSFKVTNFEVKTDNQKPYITNLHWDNTSDNTHKINILFSEFISNDICSRIDYKQIISPRNFNDMRPFIWNDICF